MTETFDAVVIGSGFGGAVTACRLAQKGLSVLILERGRRWRRSEYPREPGDAWIWDVDEPARQNGWIDLRLYDDMAVVQGAGVGGGSLIYANISVPAKPFVFQSGWPSEITYAELEPYYRRVGQMLRVQEVPDNQLPKRFHLMRDAARALGHEDRFQKLPLAVNFDENWRYGLDDPFNTAHSKRVDNELGADLGTCVHCGNCDIGCPVGAKNTLDLNYIPLAEQHGAQVRPLHLVSHLSKGDEGYQVHFDRIEGGELIPGSVLGRRVILAAGSLGSTEILLRSRDQYETLPDISDFLGRRWSSNGDFLTPAIHETRDVSPTQGPTITCAIDHLDGNQGGHRFFIEDGGFPDLLGNYLEAKIAQGSANPVIHALLKSYADEVRGRDPFKHVMPWFAQAVDAADGRLELKRSLLPPWNLELRLDWEIDRSEAVINAVSDMHQRLARATGGDPKTPITWSVFKNLITPHPLGGCNMGDSPENGVVDHLGRVFGYDGLYVADGAVIPRAIGLNPSRTIAALAERTAQHI